MADLHKKITTKISWKVYLLILILFSLRLWINYSAPLPAINSYGFLLEAKMMIHGRYPIIGLTIPHGYPSFPLMVYAYLPSAFIGEAGIKIMDAVVYALLFLVVYLLIKQLINDETIAILTGIIASLNPLNIYYVNSESLLMVSLLLYLFTIYLFLKKGFPKSDILTLLFLLTLATPLAIILGLSIMLYVLIERIRKKRVEKFFAELSVFYFLLTLWKSLIMYKSLILQPREVLFLNTKLLYEFLFTIPGFASLVFLTIYLIFGVIGLFLMKNYNKKITKILWINILVILIFSFIGIIDPLSSIVIISYLLLPGIGLSLKVFILGYAELTHRAIKKQFKIRKHRHRAIFSRVVSILLVVLLLISSIPLISYSKLMAKAHSVPLQEKNCLLMLKNREKGRIITPITNSFYVYYYSNKKPVIMNYGFLSQKELREKEMIDKIYSTPIETDAITLMKKLRAKYILVNSKIDKTPIYLNSECFKTICDVGDVSIYELKC